jgi:hypothetical protein
MPAALLFHFELRKSIALSSAPETYYYSTVEFRQVVSQTIFHVSGLMKPQLEEGFDPGLRCRPRNRGHAVVGLDSGHDLTKFHDEFRTH